MLAFAGWLDRILGGGKWNWSLPASSPRIAKWPAVLSALVIPNQSRAQVSIPGKGSNTCLRSVSIRRGSFEALQALATDLSVPGCESRVCEYLQIQPVNWRRRIESQRLLSIGEAHISLP